MPQEVFNTRMRELDRCHADLTRAQGDLQSTKQNADELANETSELRDHVTTLESDRLKQSSSLASQKQTQDLVKNALALAQRRADLYELFAAKLQPLVDAKQIVIEPGKGKLLIRMSDSTLFDAGRAELRTDGQALLRSLAAVMKQVNRDFLIASHTDNQPLPKTAAYRSSWELTTARAVAMVRFFQGEGVDPRHLGAAGYSEFTYLADNVDAEGRAQNRRVELVVMPAAEELLPLPPELGKRQAERAPLPRPALVKP